VSSLGSCPAALERTWAVPVAPSTVTVPTEMRGSRTPSNPFSSAVSHGTPRCSTVWISSGASTRSHSVA
jgi:hypothetical protein